MKTVVVLRFAVIISVFAVSAFGQVAPEFQVNSYTTQAQRDPSVASDATGNFVIVWESGGGSGQDGSSKGVFGQRFNVDGIPQGPEFQVNSYTVIEQYGPSVAADDSGKFVVVWHSRQDGSNLGVFGQRFNASGVPQGSEFQVNSYTSDAQLNPSVAMDANGDFVVAWESKYQDGSDWGVFGQRFNASGVAQGSEFFANSFFTSDQRKPAVGMNTAGDFVVVWESWSQDGSNRGVFGRRFNASGVPQGSEFQVNSYTINDQRYPSVALDGTGNFVVAWASYRQFSVPGWRVFGQRFNSYGIPQGSEFGVASYYSSTQKHSSVAMDGNGDFVVTWEDAGNRDGSQYGVFGRQFNGAGVPQGDDFPINAYTTDQQRVPSVSAWGDGDFVVAWQSAYGQDGDNVGVFAALSASTGTIILEKQTDPNDPNTIFQFDVSSIDPNDPNEFLGDDDTATYAGLLAGTYRVSELVPTGWILNNVSCSVDTGGNDSVDPNDPNDPTGWDIVVGAGQEVTCTFFNRLLIANLSVAKSVAPTYVKAGEEVTYTVMVGNAGPDDAQDVVVTDVLPAGMILLSATPSQGGCSETGGTVTCGLGTIANGSGATVTLVVEMPPGEYENTVTVTTSGLDADGAAATAPAVSVAGSDIPALDEWALMLLTLALALVGFVSVRR